MNGPLLSSDQNGVIPEKINSIAGYFFSIVICIVVGACVYFTVSVMFKSNELNQFRIAIKEDINKKWP